MSGFPDYPLGETLSFQFNTWTSAGVPITFAGTPAFEVYEDSGLVQITAGITLIVDHDSVTGVHDLSIVATAANGFESGKTYHCRVSAGTVNGTSVVGSTIQQFSIERSPALRPTVAGRDLDVTANGNAGIDWANIDNPTTSVSFTSTTINLVTTTTTATTTTTNTDMRGTDGANTTTPPTVSAIADAQWDELRAGHVISGSFGEGAASVQGNVTGSVASVTGAVGSVTGAVGSVTGSVASVTGAVGSVTASVTVGTNNDKTGYSISGTLTTLDGLNNFNPTTDTVANVTLVATTTTNTDMRGTDSANTTTPPTAAAITTAVLTTQMTESYAALGVAPTLAQSLFLQQQKLGSFSITSTTLTVTGIDGTTTKATYTLDSSTSPTSTVRAS